MIRNKIEGGPIIIDLSGHQGNAFVLLGLAKGWARDLGLNWKEIQKDAMSGDYDHLLEVIDKEFGEFVVFER